ncbi:MAG: class I fructose-bisphosphate aldolase, partial [Alphaproteobacteria bacterium]
VQDALRLGCSAIGFTIYPSSEYQFEMIEEVREMSLEAKSCGIATVVWSYPRGGNLSKEGETAVDITAYAAHMAAQLGANIIKVKPPTDFIEQPEAKKVYESEGIDISSLKARIAHVMQSAFNGRRIVVFSGGAAKDLDGVFAEIREIAAGGATGSIIGRNTFQRQPEDAHAMLDRVIKIYQGKE